MKLEKSYSKTYPTTIVVDFKRRDGWHIATSSDLPGLNVSETDFETFVSEIRPVIRAFIKIKYDIEVSVEEMSNGIESDDSYSVTYTAKPSELNVQHC